MLEKVFTKKVRFHAAIAIAIILVVLLLVNWYLRIYTRHGEKISVPDVKGKTFEQAEDILNDANLDVRILDSGYVADVPPNSVLDQTPKPNAEVKGGRTIFLTLNSHNVPSVEVPDLVGKSSFRSAKLQLESFGLKVNSPVYQSSPHEGALLDLLYNGHSISGKTKLPKGSHVTPVVGQGLSNVEVQVPYLIGLTYAEAVNKLREYGLSAGATVPDDDVTDTQNAIVYRQNPDFSVGKTIRGGEEIDIFIATELPSNVSVNSAFYSVGAADTSALQ
ncbi:MAG TPA: PASTA domain-containing protein [Chitinophagales bacterium]